MGAILHLKIFLVIVAAFSQVSAYSQQNGIKKNTSLKVLYVGQHPDKPEGYTYGGNRKVMEAHKKWRAQDYMDFLNQHFSNVTLIYGHEYKESMSGSYDVTIFDAAIPIIKEKEYRVDEETGRKYIKRKADYLSDDFDAAAIMVAGLPAILMANMNSKIKWACHCLREHAFGMDLNHPVFSAPHKVDLIEETIETPSNYLRFYSGRHLGETMKMVRMQKENVPEGFAPGFVSYHGFDDSPDAEALSYGTNIKPVNSVAIGRHGNFFQWGFRASPKYMTDFAKKAFINSIHYIAKFKGRKPFVHRKTAARTNALDVAYAVSDQGFEQRLKRVNNINSRIDAAKVKVMAGIDVTRGDEKYAKRDYSQPDRTFMFKYLPKELIKKYVADWNAYLRYYEENMGYIIPAEGFNEFKFDEDAKTLGIANDDIKLLDACVEMLNDGDRPELALRILRRYTQEDFEKPKAWKKWLKKNRDKLFFTETGGYKFLVDQTL